MSRERWTSISWRKEQNDLAWTFHPFHKRWVSTRRRSQCNYDHEGFLFGCWCLRLPLNQFLFCFFPDWGGWKAEKEEGEVRGPNECRFCRSSRRRGAYSLTMIGDIRRPEWLKCNNVDTFSFFFLTGKENEACWTIWKCVNGVLFLCFVFFVKQSHDCTTEVPDDDDKLHQWDSCESKV